MNKKIAFLKGYSLFTDGLLSRLARTDHISQIQVIDLCHPDPLATILRESPDILVVDENDPKFTENLRDYFFTALPMVKLILLDSSKASVRVIMCNEYCSPRLSDLFEVGDLNFLTFLSEPAAK